MVDGERESIVGYLKQEIGMLVQEYNKDYFIGGIRLIELTI